jgi:hypothetical protein
MDDLDRLKLNLPTLETVGGNSGWSVGAHQSSAFRSCAKQLNLPIELVLRAAGTNQLGKLIEQRSGRNAAKRNVERIRNLYRKREIAARQVPPWS